jgi:WD40 repeat protein
MTRHCLPLIVLLVIGSAATAAPPPAVSAVAYHPQGKFVAFGTHGEVRLFNPQTGDTVRKLGGQTGRVTALGFSPDGRMLAVASGYPAKAGVVRIYTVSDSGDGTDQPVAALAAHADAVYALAFSPDGKLFVSAGYDRVIHVFAAADMLTGDPVPKRTLNDHSDAVYGLSFHPDGKLLASASADRAVKVWDVETGKRLYTLSDPTDWVYAIAWSPDRKHLAAAGVDRSIRVWEADRDGGKLVHSVFAHVGPVWRVAYTADGKTLFSAGEDRVIKAWDAAKMVESRTFPAQPDAVLSLAVRPDGKQLAVGRFDGVGQLLDTDSGKLQSQPLPAKPLKLIAERLTPAAGVRGLTTRLTVTGKNLDEVKSVTTSLPGVTVKLGSNASGKLELDLAIPPTVAAGAVQLTLENEAGKTTPLTFAIDRYPATPESGLTDSAQRAMPVKLPATLVGSIDRAGDVDYFRFEAKAGQQVGVQVVAAELGSKLDPVLSLTDLNGSVLAEGNGGLLGFTVPTAGTYAIGIRDREFRGGPELNYRLHLGDVPVITGVFPLAASRGRTGMVHIDGVNLGRPNGVALAVTPPMEAAPGTRHMLDLPLTPAGEKPLGQAFVVVDELPSVVISPSDGADLRVPGSADGILMKLGDAQATRFTAKKGDRLVVEVLARRAGSPVDPVVEILDAAGKAVPRATLRCTAKTFSTFRDHDSASPGIRLEYWNELAINDYLYVDGELTRIFALPRNPDDDCQFYQVAGQRLGFLDTTPAHHSQGTPMYRVELHPPGRAFPPNGLPVFTLPFRNDDGGPGYGKDSRLFFDVPADGQYQARVTDARGAGGPGHAYRVTIRPPKPDFTVSFSPTAPSVWKGGAIPVSVTATRLDGFEGPIRLELQGLPPGFTAPVTFIEGNQTTTAFSLHAQADAKAPTSGSIKLVAKATINGNEVLHESAGGLPKTIEPGDIVTTTRQEVVRIKPGQETRLVVDVERRGDFKGRIPLDVRGLPHGVRVLNIGLNGILVTERDTSREVVIYAEPWVQPMDHPIVVLARSERKNTEHAAKSVLLKVEK